MPEMYPMYQKSWNLLIGVIIFSLSCNLVNSLGGTEDTQIPTLQKTVSPSSTSTSTQRYITSTPLQTPSFPIIDGTIISTNQMLGAVRAIFDTKYTNNDGEIIIEDSDSRTLVQIKVKNESEGIPLSEILLYWMSFRGEYFVVASDPQGRYLPAAQMGDYSDLRGLTNSNQQTLFEKSNLKQDWQLVELVLKLLDGLNDIESLSGLAGYLVAWPDIVEHADFKGWYAEYCLTGKQTANLVSAIGLFIPGASSFGVKGSELILAAAWAISLNIFEEKAEEIIMSLEGRHQWRIYISPLPWPLITYHGRCDRTTVTPTITITPTSTHQPINVRVYDIIQGTDVYFTCEQIASMEWTFSCCCSMEWNSPYPEIRYILYIPDALDNCTGLPPDIFPQRTCD